ncbi:MULTISPECIES: hypothetical protein [unclassified Duganella]|uniref:hypothetical protein n=1 Tax=unclassified Duganella TaxID=2636909 RepID=UPI0008839DB0|nr:MULTISPECIES: hypothetical protein [unclassified Duganella]SDG76984.1 hypothetical protein SAMN05216320_1073 [Duganella sp. OV458]SDK03911.1 hypothetical protein SAMN05428973_1083 [Duganella sp. OV510]
MLRFPSKTAPLILEDFLREIRLDEAASLSLPIKLDMGGALGAANLAVQIVATWARTRSASTTLNLNRAFAENEATRARFASTLPGMAALYFAESVECEQRTMDRFHALTAVVPYVEAMQQEDYANTLRGIGAALCCFAGARNEFLKPLYAVPAPQGVNSESVFRVLIPRMLEALNSGRTFAINEGQLDYLSAMVYQLFLNSDQHGAYDIRGGRYKVGMRGISARLTSLQDLPTIVANAGDDPHLRSYLSRAASKSAMPAAKTIKSAHQQMQILEISVFDTGPGLALRWLGDKKGATRYDDFSLDEELEAVQTCFEKHTSTKAGNLYGQGLPVALRALQQLKAFMTLRTGRLSLYQDFSHSKTADFVPQRRFQGKDLAEIAGATYTIWFRVR